MLYRGDDKGKASASGRYMWLELDEYRLQTPPIPTDRSKFLNGDVKDVAKQKFVPTRLPDRRTYYAWPRQKQLELENQEWDRRENGVWFYNGGQPTYLTDNHYFYLNYHRYAKDSKPDYREANLEFFMVWRACKEAPNCLGLYNHTRRRDGKTSRAASIGIEGATRIKSFRFGIQSKTGLSAQVSVFNKEVLPAVKALQDCPWFMPELRGKIDPANNLKFDTPTTTKRVAKGQEAPAHLESLGSEILWADSPANALDSDGMTFYFNDEVAKEQLHNSYQRWMTMVPVFMPSGEKEGMGICATTTDRIGDDDEDDPSPKAKRTGTAVHMAKKFWRTSNHTELESDEEFTESRMWRLFTPAYKGYKVDEYGRDTPAGKQHFLNIRAKLKGVALINEKRTNPFTIAEALLEEAKTNSVFSAEHIIANIAAIEAHENRTGRPLVNRYRLEWAEPAKKKPPVRAIPDPSGPWQFPWLPPADQLNQMMCIGFVEDAMGNRWPKWLPLREDDTSLGNDPVERKLSTLANKKKASKYAIAVFRPYNEWVEKERGQPTYWPSAAFIGRYNARPENPETCYEEGMKACYLFGTKMHCEKQTNALQQKYFEDHGFEECLADRALLTQSETNKGNTGPGTAASAPTTERNVGLIAQFTIDYEGDETLVNSRGEVGVNDHGVPYDYRRQPFLEVLHDNKSFDPDHTQFNDDTVAEGFCLSHAYRRSRTPGGFAGAGGSQGLDLSQFNPSNFFRG